MRLVIGHYYCSYTPGRVLRLLGLGREEPGRHNPGPVEYAFLDLRTDEEVYFVQEDLQLMSGPFATEMEVIGSFAK